MIASPEPTQPPSTQLPPTQPPSTQLPPTQPPSTQPPAASRTPLDAVTAVLAVVAHPDDESFGLGAILAELTDRGVPAGLVCFTHGEASTLHDRPGGDLAAIREDEVRQAAIVLGIQQVAMHVHPDGALNGVGLDLLASHVLALAATLHPSHLLVFDQGGITGHPDHVRATEAALSAARIANLPVLAWALPQEVTSLLNVEFDAGFVGRRPDELDGAVEVSRHRQSEAIACHSSQSTDNPVLRRRLELLGSTEHLRTLYQPRV